MEHRCRCKLRASWLAVSPAFLNFVMISSFKAVSTGSCAFSPSDCATLPEWCLSLCSQVFFDISYQLIVFLHISNDHFFGGANLNDWFICVATQLPKTTRTDSANLGENCFHSSPNPQTLWESNSLRWPEISHIFFFCFVGLQGTTSPSNANS